MFTLGAAALALGLLAACAPAEGPILEDDIGDGLRECRPGVDDKGLVGRLLNDVALPDDLNIRTVEPGMMVTMDYRRDRLTITLDEKGRIETARCG